MLYWLGVYALVVVAVAVPFLLLYLAICVCWLGLAAVRFAIRSIANARPIRADFARPNWSVVRRRAA